MSDILTKAEGAYWMFEQDQIWNDATGQTHQIAEMEPRYCSNVIRFLIRRADALACYHGMGAAVIADRWEETFGVPTDSVSVAQDAGLAELWQGQIDDPVVWMMGTPLVKALVKRIAEGDSDE